MKKLGPYVYLAAGLLAAVTVLVASCNSPLGFGKSIDWEPPVLTLDMVPNPLYVRNGTKISGTVTDNVAVDRVVLSNSITGEELLKAVIDGERWEINLVFTEEQNGEKILAQISAYDTSGNCGANSIAFLTLIIDIRPPLVEYISIQRTNTRIAFLEPFANLKDLEITDPRGEKKDNLYRYQNGWFHVNGIVSDEETKIEVVALNIYDTREINTVLLSIPRDENYTAYFPRWTVKEDDIIAAGVEKWGQGYKTNYYVNGERYYYRVTIEAADSSGNTSENIEEDEGYLCMWARSDDPKGVLDPGIGTVILRGTPLPVDFYDDDSLEWAYTGLLTENQWYGTNDVYPGTRIPAGYSDDQKLDWLRGQLLNGNTIYNWRYDKHSGQSDEIDPITEQINGKSLDEKLVYVPTGEQENDYGEYVLFTLAADRKLPPHDGTGPERTNQNVWAGKVWRVSLVDENIPLIVFDTKNGCPEENTFPKLTGGESFTIKGYTLRENASGDNSVTTFRMAWIPFGMPGGADAYIPDIKKALGADNYPSSINNDARLKGIQHWEFREGGGAGYGQFGPGVADTEVTGSIYNRQDFQKTFHVLTAADDIKADTYNFTYNGELENDTKLFVFYARDNRGHEVSRQLRLLGMKTPPNLVVYDITSKVDNLLLPGMPDPNNSLYIDSATGGLNQAYYTALNNYNNGAYGALQGVSGLTENDKTIPFQIYPRETILKYWIKASENGGIAVKSISMKDISFEGINTAPVVGSGYKSLNEAYSFCEYYPDVTQRTFLFEAEDKLGNKVQIQRTIAVTNAARLVNITTLEENGTYGIGKKISLKANFSSQIYVEGGTPLLNVRYHMKGGSWVYYQIPCSNIPSYGSPALALEFIFEVPEGTDGRLETMFDGIDISLPPSQEKRPITLNSSSIMDYFRRDAAFIPGYINESVIMQNWATVKNSLQEKKDITLDGIRPKIVAPTAAGGKTAYSDSNYYFKTGETIEFTLSADKPIRASDTPVPRLQYYIRDSGGVNRGPYSAAFTYSRPNGSSALVFSLPVNGTNCPYDGELVNVSLILGAGTIMDNVDNGVNVTAIPVPTPRIFIKKTQPPAPAATLNGVLFGTAAANFTVNVVLAIPPPPTSSDYPGFTWNDTRIQYSTNGGLAWLDYSVPVTINRDGTYDIRARYVDRAGNDGLESGKAVQVKLSFPNLIAASAAQPNGWYTAGSNLAFNLSFDDTVSVITASSVSITLKDAVTTATHTVNADPGQTNVTTVKFSWNGITGVEMPNGLYISDVNFGGLRDSINRYGGTGSGTCSAASASNIITVNGNTCPNLPYGGIKVDTIAPTVTAWSPGRNGASSAANQSVTQIVLTFREPVMKGSGIITVRPRADFAIPPVFEDTGYYLGTDGTTRYSSSGANRTYIPSFYDIYTNNALDSTDRGYLTRGSSMSNLNTHARTGQSYGPYKKMTHGLTEGRGYTGNYNNTNPGANGPNPGLGNAASIPTPGTTPTMSMIPDTATKWVLDYQYSITQNTAVVNNIRAVLSKIEFRWQKIDVVSASISGAVVTINLNEPLLKGLEWDVYYPAGTFTDLAGNPAPASGYNAAGAMLANNTDYWFTSSGAQAPVIRVNRRSYDARNSNWSLPANRNNNPQPPNYRDDHYGTPPPNTAGWQNANATVTDDPATGAGNGWGIDDFNYVHYRVESESKSAVITTKTFQGAGSGRAVGAWSGNVSAANSGVTIVNDMAWTTWPSNTAGTWVMSNIIRRSASNPDLGVWVSDTGPPYTVITKNGTREERIPKGIFGLFRSYNKDLTKSELAPTGGDTASLSGNQGVLSFNKLEASKSYIVATAAMGGESATGYEGVFRTVIALNHSPVILFEWVLQPGGWMEQEMVSYPNKGRADKYILVEGSTAPSATPPIAGFPVRDAEESRPGGLVKAFYNDTAGEPRSNTQFYWVSTEIVCEWLFLQWGGGYWHGQDGESSNYSTVGYGDLTYAYNLRSSDFH